MFRRSGRQEIAAVSRDDGTTGNLLAERVVRRARLDETDADDRAARLGQLTVTLDVPLTNRLETERVSGRTPGEIARIAGETIQAHFRAGGIALSVLELRDFVNRVLLQWSPTTEPDAENGKAATLSTAYQTPQPTRIAPPVLVAQHKPKLEPRPAAGVATLIAPASAVETAREVRPDDAASRMIRSRLEQARKTVQAMLLKRMDVAAAAELPRDELQHQLDDLVREILIESKIQLNRAEQNELLAMLLDEMLGLGPVEPLLRDETVTDILVNGPKQVYIERRGKLELTDVTFDDNAHVFNICNRIVSRIGRRVDESSPIADARLADGSRVNIIIPPLALDGPSISIRKFGKKAIGFDQMATQGNMSPQMATVLRIASRCRLNILISGGTGSGKTTLLNALSGMIALDERVVTIEDAAELRLQQPHVVRLETRPPNLEGNGEITMRDLVKNALRMRPERIILGEVRGPEAVDLLQAMNTGHDGSMGTLHANRPREALIRLENMLAMANLNIPNKAMRTQIAGSLNLIVQIQRMRDGMRRITHITEITGMEGDVITTQDLFTFEFKGEGADGRLTGLFKSTGLRPNFLPKAAYFGLEKALMEAMG
ncbi:CpaF family protein [Reyranella sp. CPCC 100927]|uniref:CpaF family protein n=1 Tax=Reyranella sp. CPCC 100927 TaxID=2599616 RepID=UPI0011B36FE5|nr:CpaF family protein [Reyranella sp. CPCC 100927]TWT10217.1 CpaF family protein [Reyranella sp. CPCC 100927]